MPAQNRRQRRRLLQQRARLRPRYQWQAAERRVKGCRHGSCPAVANVRSSERVAESSRGKLEPKFAMAAASRRPRSTVDGCGGASVVAALRRPLWPAEEMRTATMAPAMTAASQQPLCTSDLLLRLPMKQALAAAVRRPRCLTAVAALVLVAALRRPAKVMVIHRGSGQDPARPKPRLVFVQVLLIRIVVA